MSLNKILVLICCPLFVYSTNQDTISIDYKLSKILLNDSSGIHAIMYNQMESIYTPVLQSFNLGGCKLNLSPNFELNDWMDNSLFLFYNHKSSFEYSNKPIAESNYSYGLDDSHSIFVNYSDKVYNTNINSKFRRFASKSIFPNSDSKGLNFLLNFDRNNGKWITSYGYYRNNYLTQEIGGLKSITDFINEPSLSVFSLNGNLSSAQNEVLNQGGYFNNLYIINSVNVDSSNFDTTQLPKFYHGISINSNVDQKQIIFSMNGNDLDSLFFKNNYLNTNQSWDSIGYVNYSYNLNYHILDTFKRNVFKLGYLGNQFNLPILNQSKITSSYSYYKLGNFNINAFYIFDGLWKGGYNIAISEKFKIRKRSLFEICIFNDHNLPGYFFMNYSSNHFKWNNNFDFVNQQKLTFNYLDTKIKTGLKINVNRLNNWIYFDEESIPQQLNSSFIYSSISLNNAFQSKFVRFYTLLQYQNSTSDVIRFPDLLIRNTLDYYFKIGKINLTMGYVFTYFTSFKGMDYNPALRRTFIQNQTDVGGFPLLDLFASIKIGGADIYVKWENVLFNTVSREFFLYPSYPIMPRFLRVGFNWKFLD